MKTNRILTLIAILLSFTFVQCTSDLNEGPQGVAGIDGTNGLDGATGADGANTVASCVACHSDSHRAPIEAAFMTSVHYTGTSAAYAGTRSSCAKCHSNQGFIDFISGDYQDDDGNRSVNLDYSYIGDNLTCTGCHTNHESFDFDTDGPDYALRTLESVPLYFLEGSGYEYTIDYGNASNTCANCHQPRRGAPTPTTYPGQYMNTSSHWGPHHGPQTALLEGIQGAYSTFTTLVEPIPAAMAGTHRTGSSCIECHMGETTDGSAGHSWNPALNNCATCHTSSVPTEVTYADGTTLTEEMATLGALLEAVVGQAIERDASNAWVPAFEADGVTPKEVHGVVHFDGEEWHPVVGLFDITASEAGWNFLFILEDKSEGLHNPDYAKSIIRNSIKALE